MSYTVKIPSITAEFHVFLQENGAAYLLNVTIMIMLILPSTKTDFQTPFTCRLKYLLCFIEYSRKGVVYSKCISL